MATPRGTEAPMDYQWTNRQNRTPSWVSTDDPSTPRKRPHNDLTHTPSALDAPRTPFFGSNQNVPFIFNQNAAPSTPHQQPWAPPPLFSPDKAFPKNMLQDEPNDVDMSEVSPDKVDDKKPDSGRVVALGGMRRIYNMRQKSRDGRMGRRRIEEGEHDGFDDSESDDETDRAMSALTQNTSNHYTLNIPAPPPPQSDLPYILLGYLQFLFNLSLLLLFLYVVVQFILTVQRDVEQRISEYSSDIVQEIAICTLQYKTNLCATNAVPAMAQQCANWETCMNRDPTIVGRAKVGAEMIAEVVNGFVEPISWKALAFTLTSLSFLTIFINSLLSLYRTRHHPIPATAAPTQHQPFSTATPYPPHQFGGYLSPAPTPSWGRSRSRLVDEDPQTPTRRRRLDGGGSVKIK